jgi:hypothetical protein
MGLDRAARRLQARTDLTRYDPARDATDAELEARIEEETRKGAARDQHPRVWGPPVRAALLYVP